MEKSIAKDLLSIGAVFLRPEQPFTWASGIKSPIYCDNRLTLTAPVVRGHVEAGLAGIVRTKFPGAEVLMGTSTAGIAHAAITATILDLPMGYVRSGSKDHGRGNRIEGKLEKGQKVVVIEDLISTGGSCIEVVNALREAGAEVLGVASIFTYGMKKGLERLKEADVVNYSLSNLDALVEVAAEEGYIEPGDKARQPGWNRGTYRRRYGLRNPKPKTEKKNMRHLIDPTDLTVAETEQIVALAEDIIANRAKYSEACKGKKLATLFYEPSTRTRLSFTSAMMELGGSVIGFSDANSSSVSKGETVADTVRVIRCFADIIAMRHFKEGAPLVASQYAGVPVINAGDGSHSHPTQTLTDLLTIKREKGRFDNMTIGFCGDLKFGRTVHSLIKALSRYSGIKVILIAPQELRLPDYMLAEMSENSKLEFREVETMEEVMPELDVLYMTRVQKERFLDEEEFDRVKNSFVLNPEKLGTAKEDMIILHPLPRVNEITRAVDNDPRAAYFRQVENGKFVRMALILTLLRWADRNKPFERTPVFNGEYVVNEMECSNRRCISATEDVDQLFYRTADGTCRCAYCEAKAR